MTSFKDIPSVLASITRALAIAAMGIVIPISTACASTDAPPPAAGSEAAEAGDTPAIQPCGPVVSHRVTLSLDIPGRRATGTDEITITPGEDPEKGCKATLYIREGSRIDAIRSRAGDMGYTSTHVPEDKARRVEFMVDPSPGTSHPISTSSSGAESNAAPGSTFEVDFSGEFDTIESTRVNIKRGVAFVGDGVMGPEGALLLTSALWHPQDEDGLSAFELTVTVPEGYTAVAEGERTAHEISENQSTTTWKTSRPIDGVNLVVGKYVTTRVEHNGVDIYTFFFADDDALERTYIEKTKEYLDLYGEMFGPYPFRKFAVVENFLPTGYGMPSFTLLGSGVLRLPFIPDTSLGHEIAHSWWGNSVYNDPEDGGNWVESLTTFVSDYMYERRKGDAEARGFRLRNLRAYRNFSTSVRISLEEFTDATTPASRVVGYNKGLMVFVMLESLIGPEAFNSALKDLYSTHAFSRATWTDLRAAFEHAAGEDLGWFFKQWLTRKGGPAIRLKEANILAGSDTNGPFELTFTVEQDGPAYRLFLPVRVTTRFGTETRRVMVSSSSDTLTIDSPARPIAIEIDPDYEVFRLMSDEEIPPALGGCFGDSSTVIVMPNSSRKQRRYFRIAELMQNDYGLTLTTDAEIARQDFLHSSSLIILGGPGENLLSNLSMDAFQGSFSVNSNRFTVGGETYTRANSMVAVAVKNPHNPARTYCLVTAGPEFGDDDHVFATGRRIRYYSQKSYIVFTGADNGAKPVTGVFDSGSPLKRSFPPEP